MIRFGQTDQEFIDIWNSRVREVLGDKYVITPKTNTTVSTDKATVTTTSPVVKVETKEKSWFDKTFFDETGGLNTLGFLAIGAVALVVLKKKK